MPELNLLERRVDTLFQYDTRGRMTGVNYWASRPAPRFFLMRSESGAIWRFRSDVPDALAMQLAELARHERLSGPDEAYPMSRDRYVELLCPETPMQEERAGPSYVFEHYPPAGVAPVAIGNSNADLLRGSLDEWLPDVSRVGPFMAALDDGKAVSVCGSVRMSEFVHCAGVETHPAYRRRGHAVNAVAGWAEAVRNLGRTPFYSTSWSNLASQAVARRLGLTLAGVDYALS